MAIDVIGGVGIFFVVRFTGLLSMCRSALSFLNAIL